MIKVLYKLLHKPGSNTLVLQTEFNHTLAYINYKFYNPWDQSLNEKGKDYISLLLHLCLSITGQTGSFNRSDRPARNPCANTDQTGQTGPNKTDRVHTLPTGVQPDKPLT